MDNASNMSCDDWVFISYASEDQNIAQKLFKDLKEVGLMPWIDTEYLLPGQKWRIEIEKAIKNSRYFIAILSNHSTSKRGYVQKELKVAIDCLDEFPESFSFIIPIRIDECIVDHSKLREIQYVNMFPSWSEGLNKIVKSIKAIEHVAKNLFQDCITEEKINIEFTIYEGVWERSDGGTYCARTVGGNLFIPYCYTGNDKLSAHFFNCILSNNKLIARFQWFNRPTNGWAYFERESDDILVGGWWHERDLDSFHNIDKTELNELIPQMHPITLLRKIVPYHFGLKNILEIKFIK